MSVHFDTLDFVKTPTAAGVAQPHAEPLAKAHAKSLDDLVRNELASKSDVAALRAESKSELAGLRFDLKSEVAGLESRISRMRSELKADFQLELRSLKFAASIAMGFVSPAFILSRLIR